jgi:putative transposase
VSHHGPRRLPGFDYRGRYRYFATCCTARRRHVFTQASAIEALALQIRQTCDEREFALLAYVFMPDHLHLVVEGDSEVSDFRAFMTLWRKRTAVTFRRYHNHMLWQHGYFERVLRKDEDIVRVIDYIVGNPVRAGLVQRAETYPFTYTAPARLKSGATTRPAPPPPD